jgi:adenylate cyclase class 2
MATTPGPLEREIKLQFPDEAAAREALRQAGASTLRARRLQRDWLVDTPDGMMRNQRAILRVRMDDRTCGFLTFKGPVMEGEMKVREEREVGVSDPAALLQLLELAGFRVWFHYEKYREEFTTALAPQVVVALDETPVGTFVELEGDADGIRAIAAALGREAGDYIRASYRDLFLRFCEEQGRSSSAMLFASA